MISNSWVVRGNLHPSWHFHVEDTPTTSSLSTPTHGKCCQAAAQHALFQSDSEEFAQLSIPPFAVLHARLYFFLFHVKKEHPCCHPAPPSCSFSKPSCDENSSFFVVVFFNFTWKSSQLGRGLLKKKKKQKAVQVCDKVEAFGAAMDPVFLLVISSCLGKQLDVRWRARARFHQEFWIDLNFGSW